jgi:hypothetical protein
MSLAVRSRAAERALSQAIPLIRREGDLRSTTNAT